MSAPVAALQAAINRLAPAGQFMTVKVDGGMGTETALGTASALTWIAEDGCAYFACANEILRAQANGFLKTLAAWGTVDQGLLATNAGNLAVYFGTIADSLGLEKEIVPVRPSSAGMTPMPYVPPRPKLPSQVPSSEALMTRFSRLETWQKIGIGAGAVLGVLYVKKHYFGGKGAKRT